MACQTIYVAAKAGAEMQQALEPAEALRIELHHHAYKYHGENRAEAHNIPHPRAEKQIAQHYGYSHKAYIDDNLGCSERHATRFAHGGGEAFAGHRHRAATHLKGNACSEKQTAADLSYSLLPQRGAYYPLRKSHAQIQKEAEEKAYYKL